MISHKVEIFRAGKYMYSQLHKYLDSDTIFTIIPQSTADLEQSQDVRCHWGELF